MKRKKYIGYFLLMSLVAFWLFFSNQIIGSFSENQVPQKSSLVDYPPKDQVYFSFGPIHNLGDFEETVTIGGWAFTETELDNLDFKTYLLLANDKYCYELAFVNPTDDNAYKAYVSRNDVVEAYPNMKFYSDHVGFISDFSTFNIKQGIYDAYIYRRENQENYGLVHTGKQFVKSESQLEMRDWVAMPLDTEPGTITGKDVPSSLDLAAIENSTLVLRGWIFAQGKDCGRQTVYMRLQGNDMVTYYSAHSVPRPDVAEGHDNPLYNLSGFNTSIKLNELPQGNMNVTLLTQVDGQLFQGKSYTLVRDGDTITINR